jgi:hypothetical protein
MQQKGPLSITLNIDLGELRKEGAAELIIPKIDEALQQKGIDPEQVLYRGVSGASKEKIEAIQYHGTDRFKGGYRNPDFSDIPNLRPLRVTNAIGRREEKCGITLEYVVNVFSGVPQALKTISGEQGNDVLLLYRKERMVALPRFPIQFFLGSAQSAYIGMFTFAFNYARS